MKAFIARRRKRMNEFACRVENFWYWWLEKKMPIRHAWEKADLTL